MADNINKQRTAKANYDPSSVDSNSYNNAAGGRKVTLVGHHLKPIKTGLNTYTTDISTRTKVGQGVTLAIYAKSDSTVTIGGSGVLSLAVGVTDANGKVGIPVVANTWIYLNTYLDDYIISSSNNIVAYIVEDDTYIVYRP